MTTVFLCLAIIIVAFAWRVSCVPIKHRWRRRQARIMCDAFCGRDRSQPPALIYARLRAMDAVAFEELLLESLERPGHVRAYASLCAARGSPGLFIHTGRTGSGRHDVDTRHGKVEIVSGRQLLALVTGGAVMIGGGGVVRRKVASICAVLVALMAVPAIAQVHGKGTVAQERSIARCIHQSARGKPWLEKTLWALRDQEGGWIGAEVRNRGGSYDLGPMQINSWWVPRMARLVDRSPGQIWYWLRRDACFNIEAARWLLLNRFAASSDYWKAVGSYHSPTKWRQRRYAIAVSQWLKRRHRNGSNLANFRNIVVR